MQNPMKQHGQIFNIIIINIFMWQTRFPFDYTTVRYSTEDTEIKLALNCKDFQAWKPGKTQRVTACNTMDANARGVHTCTTSEEVEKRLHTSS